MGFGPPQSRNKGPEGPLFYEGLLKDRGLFAAKLSVLTIFLFREIDSFDRNNGAH